jgi:anti-sigma factor RsiW
MTNPSFHDIEQLSASLDGQIRPAEKARLEARLRSDAALATVLIELRQARDLLRLTPKRSLPRNFTLTPKMTGIRPPLPRSVPALSWASATAMLLFVLTFGTNLLSQFSFGAAAPMLAAAPMTSEGYGLGGGPAATQPSGLDNLQTTPTPEISVFTAPEPSALDGNRQVAPPATTPAAKSSLSPALIWSYVWLGLAAVLFTTALLIRQASVMAFHRRLGGNKTRQK